KVEPSTGSRGDPVGAPSRSSGIAGLSARSGETAGRAGGVERRARRLTRPLRALGEHVVDVAGILLQLPPARARRRERGLDLVEQELLGTPETEAAGTVLGLQVGNLLRGGEQAVEREHEVLARVERVGEVD